MTVIVLDCCEHPHTQPGAPRRWTLAGIAAVAARWAVGTVAAVYAIALYGTVLGTLLGIAIRGWLR